MVLRARNLVTLAESFKTMKEIPQNIKLALKEAKDVLDKGGAEAAEEARAKLLDISEASAFPIYHMLLAKIAKELNQKDTALAHLEKSLEFDQPSIQAILRVAESRIRMAKKVMVMIFF